MSRTLYAIDLAARVPGLHADSIRSVSVEDRTDLAVLMLAAYAGTPDDEGESLADARDEIEAWTGRGADYSCSFVEIHATRIRAACLVEYADDRPFISYAITAPGSKRQGLARQVVDATLDSLATSGVERVWLVITDGNVASERLFTSVGARPAASPAD